MVDDAIVNGVRFEEVRGDAGASMPWHDHPATYIDFYVSGAAETSWHSDVHAFTASVIPAGFRHRSRCVTNTHTFQVVVPEPWFEDFRQVERLQIGSTVFTESRPTQVVSGMFRVFRNRDDLAGIDLQDLLFTFWAASGAKAMPGRWLSQVEEYLHAHYAETPSPQCIAEAIGIHPAHLMREFRRAHRCTVGDYVRALRVEHACRLMKTMSKTLAEVAHEVGFADQSHFNRSFRASLGVTPSEYLREIRR